MRKSRAAALVITLFISLSAMAQNAIYTKEDQEKASKILNAEYNSSGGEKLLEIAKKFIGTPYVAGTLDRNSKEQCTVNLSEVDCTTFMDQALALYMASNGSDSDKFNAFAKNLELIRYRNGVCNGYASRLHYISWWIDEMSTRGILKEIEAPFSITRKLNINYMSTHPDSYTQLKGNPGMVKEIEEYEMPYRGRKVKYIPKEKLSEGPEVLPIKNGDIIAIVTTIEGLDVTHVGYAFWVSNKLHLIHASSISKEVIVDRQSLYDYMKNKKSQCGIRVFRAI